MSLIKISYKKCEFPLFLHELRAQPMHNLYWYSLSNLYYLQNNFLNRHSSSLSLCFECCGKFRFGIFRAGVFIEMNTHRFFHKIMCQKSDLKIFNKPKQTKDIYMFLCWPTQYPTKKTCPKS